MEESDSIEIALDLAMPTENMEDKFRDDDNGDMAFSRQTNRHCNNCNASFSSKVMHKLLEMQFYEDMSFRDSKKISDLIEILESSSVDDEQRFRGNEKMRELIMEMQFSSSVNDMPFSDNLVRIMFHVLYEVVSDKSSDAYRFIYVVEQICKEDAVDLATIFNQVTPTGDSFLHVAAEHGSEEVVWVIAFHYPKLLYKRNMKGDTPLHVAARAKNVLAIKNILDMEKHYFTTTSSEEDDKVEFLMLRNNCGMTALHEAVLSKDYSVVLFLLLAHDQQSDLSTYWKWNFDYGCKSPMYLAALTRNKDILSLLLSHIPIPSRNAISNGDSPVHAAMPEQNEDLLVMIIYTREELLYQRDEKNNTPLHYAAYAGYLEAVSIMLEASPTVAFQRNSDGNLPIHLACKNGHIQVVKKLLEIEWSNAGLFLNNKGHNILHVAARKGQTETIKHLLKHPKIHDDTINGRDLNGETPLHLAARKLRLWTLLLLSSRHEIIDVNTVNNEGLTARDVVRMQCRIPMTRQQFLADAILESAGVPLKANKLGIKRTTSTNKEWNVKEAANTLILVAILIAVVTFMAGFTVAGGFYSSDGPISKQRGMPLLANNQTLFKIFMPLNTIAMYSSTIGSVVLLWVPLGDLRFAEGAFALAKVFVSVALTAMPVAFLAATRLIVASNNTLVAIVMGVIGFISIFFITSFPILATFPLRIRLLPMFRPIADVFIRTIIGLFYGRSDVLANDHVGKVNRVNQVDSRNRMNEAFAIDMEDEVCSN